MSRGKKPKPNPAAGGSGRLARRVLVVALTLAAAAGLVWGVATLGDAARSRVGSRDRYAVRFADITCDPPPGTDRSAFLSEVRYVSNFPEAFQSLDPDLPAKLAPAFAAHPWVAAFDGVEVGPDGGVTVKLRFRSPVLAVRSPDGSVRVVDAAGVLLPPDAKSDGLPELRGVGPPTVAAGREWPDAKRPLELLEAHHPRLLEKTAEGWRLTTDDGKTLVVGK